MKRTGMNGVPSAAALAIMGAWAAVQAGCNNDHFLGSVDSGAPPVCTLGPTPFDAGADAADAGLPAPTQSWTGYIENFQFASGSDAVKLAFATDDAGNMIGTITLGAGSPPPPATDPDAVYPPSTSASGLPTLIDDAQYPWEGFAYTLVGGTMTDARMQFGASLFELWQGWCALQTPAADCSGLCSDTGPIMASGNTCFTTDQATHQNIAINCVKSQLCYMSQVCECGTATCAASRGEDLMFDVAITAGAAEGSVDGLISNHNVHLAKDP